MRPLVFFLALCCCAPVWAEDLFADPDLDRLVVPLEKTLALESLTITYRRDDLWPTRRLVFPGRGADQDARKRRAESGEPSEVILSAIESLQVVGRSKMIDVTIYPDDDFAAVVADDWESKGFPYARSGRFVAMGDGECLVKFAKAAGWPAPVGVVALADRVATAPAMAPKALAAALKKAGEPVKWVPAMGRERAKKMAGRVVWASEPGTPAVAVEVYDLRRDASPADAVALLDAPGFDGCRALVAGRWVYAGNPARLKIVAEGLHAND